MKKRDLIGCNLRPGMMPGGMAHGDRLRGQRTQLDDRNAVKAAANQFLESRGFVVRSRDFISVGSWTNPAKVNGRT
jgi:hypothetical protein